jgi:hypothetical protein
LSEVISPDKRENFGMLTQARGILSAGIEIIAG